MREFKCGDLVRLRSGSPLMVVKYPVPPNEEYGDEPRVRLTWFNKNNQEFDVAVLPTACLVEAIEDDPRTTKILCIWGDDLDEEKVKDLRFQVDKAQADPDYSIISNFEVCYKHIHLDEDPDGYSF